MESEEEDEQEETKDHPTHYACPLGYISMNINGKNFQALLDNGSMVNVLSLSFACKMGLIITEKKMNLKGIGGHKNEIIGIAENVPVQIGQITKDVHFWISFGDVVVFHLRYNAKSTLQRCCDSIVTCTRHSLQEEEFIT